MSCHMHLDAMKIVVAANRDIFTECVYSFLIITLGWDCKHTNSQKAEEEKAAISSEHNVVKGGQLLGK